MLCNKMLKEKQTIIKLTSVKEEEKEEKHTNRNSNDVRVK